MLRLATKKKNPSSVIALEGSHISSPVIASDTMFISSKVKQYTQKIFSKPDCDFIYSVAGSEHELATVFSRIKLKCNHDSHKDLENDLKDQMYKYINDELDSLNKNYSGYEAIDHFRLFPEIYVLRKETSTEHAQVYQAATFEYNYEKPGLIIYPSVHKVYGYAVPDMTNPMAIMELERFKEFAKKHFPERIDGYHDWDDYIGELPLDAKLGLAQWVINRCKRYCIESGGSTMVGYWNKDKERFEVETLKHAYYYEAFLRHCSKYSMSADAIFTFDRSEG